jgi:hypothetical protein
MSPYATDHETNRRGVDGERGFVLLGVLLFSTVLLILGIFGTSTARTELRIAHNDMLHKQAMAAAEAGISHAFVLLGQDFSDGFDDDLSTDGTGGGLTALGSLVTRDGQRFRFHDFGAHSGDGYYVRVLDNYDETPDNRTTDNDWRIRLVSRGEVGEAQSIVEAVVLGQSLFPPYGLYGDTGVDVSGGSTVDSYDAGAGPYPNGPGNHGSVGSNGDIEINGSGSTVNGDATAAGTVDPGSGTVTGDTLEGADPRPLPAVPVCGPPYSDGTGITGGSYSATTGELVTQGRGRPSDIVLASGTYCFSSITLGAGRTLTISGTVRIFLTGASDLSGGSLVNPGNPRDLVILSSYSGTGDGITLSGGSGANAGIYAPQTDVKITGNGEFSGGVVGKTVSVPGGARFHFDEQLTTLPGLRIELVNWRESVNP